MKTLHLILYRNFSTGYSNSEVHYKVLSTAFVDSKNELAAKLHGPTAISSCDTDCLDSLTLYTVINEVETTVNKISKVKLSDEKYIIAIANITKRFDFVEGNHGLTETVLTYVNKVTPLDSEVILYEKPLA